MTDDLMTRNISLLRLDKQTLHANTLELNMLIFVTFDMLHNLFLDILNCKNNDL